MCSHLLSLLCDSVIDNFNHLILKFCHHVICRQQQVTTPEFHFLDLEFQTIKINNEE